MESFSSDIHAILQELKESEQQANEIISVFVHYKLIFLWHKLISPSDRRSLWQFMLLHCILLHQQVCWHEFISVKPLEAYCQNSKGIDRFSE